MIEIRDLTKTYGTVQAIKDLNFTVKKGEVVGFLGPNGAGKSTTMKIITGFMAPSSGSVRVGGFDVFDNPLEVKRKIGYLPETPPLYLDLKVRDFLSFVAELKGVPRKNLKSKVDFAVDKTGLGSVQKRLIQNLSKGFRQRVGLAQALVSDPELLILDEPTIGLDPKQVAEIRGLINELKGSHTIVLSTHILSEVQATCEKIIIVSNGEIAAQDTLKGLNNRMSGSRRVVVTVRRPSASLLENLKKVAGVIDVKTNGAAKTYEIDTEDNEEIPEAIASQVVGEGAGLTELRSLNLSLEEIFLKLTSDTIAKGAVQ